jgi:hypothetical protein
MTEDKGTTCPECRRLSYTEDECELFAKYTADLDKCSICLEDLSSKIEPDTEPDTTRASGDTQETKIVLLRCMHYFCETCWNSWKKQPRSQEETTPEQITLLLEEFDLELHPIQNSFDLELHSIQNSRVTRGQLNRGLTYVLFANIVGSRNADAIYNICRLNINMRINSADLEPFCNFYISIMDNYGNEELVSFRHVMRIIDSPDEYKISFLQLGDKVGFDRTEIVYGACNLGGYQMITQAQLRPYFPEDVLDDVFSC